MPALSELSPAVLQFLDTPNIATVSTINRDGTPQTTYVIFMRAGDEMQFSTLSPNQKAKNLRRNPRLTFAIIDPQNTQKWVIISGTATVGEIGGADVWEYMEANARRRMSPEEAKAYVERAKSDPRVLVRITPVKIRTSGFPE